MTFSKRFIVLMLSLFTGFPAHSKTIDCGTFPEEIVQWNLDSGDAENSVSFSFPLSADGYSLWGNATVNYGSSELEFEVPLYSTVDEHKTGYLTVNGKGKKVKVCAFYSHGACTKNVCSVHNKR